jgi:putative CocE/NonD family hydrolase
MKIPALLLQTRYWRSMELRTPFKWFFQSDDVDKYFRDFKPFFIGQGYALVRVDVRGTGASFGVWPFPWHRDTIQDSYEVVDWIVSQPWSNGRVAGWGISYLGTTSEILPACGHTAVKASIAMFNHPDAYLDITFPGGVFNNRFIREWGRMDYQLDNNIVPKELGLMALLMVKGVKPVAGAEGLLSDAIHSHRNNGNVYGYAKDTSFRDQMHPELGGCIDDMQAQQHWGAIQKSGAAICGWGSWMDAGTADAVIHRFLTLENPQMGVIGAWEHGGQLNASPYRSARAGVNPELPQQWAEMANFLAHYVHEDGQAFDTNSNRVLHYYTMGEEKWKIASSWPPAEMKNQRWYLREGQSLSLEMPLTDEGYDTYPVDFEASTGLKNRWWELGAVLQQTVSYQDRSKAARHMLVYLSPPLEHDLEISGYPLVRMFLTSTESDGAFFVYLEDVDHDGRVNYITEGQLRALHRKIAVSTGTYYQQAPYHTYKQADASPLEPGEMAELHFYLHPTSVLVRKGHRLRLGIAGHDRDTFTRIPSQGFPVISLARNNLYPSYIEFPAKSVR